jgi:hypothetical protein
MIYIKLFSTFPTRGVNSLIVYRHTQSPMGCAFLSQTSDLMLHFGSIFLPEWRGSVIPKDQINIYRILDIVGFDIKKQFHRLGWW